MAKFCGKCGTKLDEKTGLCPKCEKENIAQENVKQKNVVLNRKQRRKEKRKERKTRKIKKLYMDSKKSKFQKAVFAYEVCFFSIYF